MPSMASSDFCNIQLLFSGVSRPLPAPTAVPGRLLVRMSTSSYEVTDSLAADDESKCRQLLQKYRHLVTKGDLCAGDCPNDGLSCSSGVCRSHLRLSKVGHPRPLFNFFKFWSFRANIAFFATIWCEKCPSHIWCWDSNPWPLEWMRVSSHNHLTRVPSIWGFFKVGHPRPLLIYFRSFQRNIGIFTSKWSEEMSNQYLILGFVPTTSQIRVSSRNPLDQGPAHLRLKYFYSIHIVNGKWLVRFKLYL